MYRIFFSTFGFLVIIGTTYDYFMKKFHGKMESKRKSKTNKKKYQKVNFLTYCKINKFLLKFSDIFGEIITSFSAINSIPKILNTNVTKTTFTAIHGMRAITISWVILGHTYFSARTSIGE